MDVVFPSNKGPLFSQICEGMVEGIVGGIPTATYAVTLLPVPCVKVTLKNPKDEVFGVNVGCVADVEFMEREPIPLSRVVLHNNGSEVVPAIEETKSKLTLPQILIVSIAVPEVFLISSDWPKLI